MKTKTPTWMKNLKVHSHSYHRNGIGGLGFHAMAIEWEEDGRAKRAIVTVCGNDLESYRAKRRHDPATRVLMIAPTGGVDLDDTMRGDNFHEPLCGWLIKNGK